jgi:hypothetical protein
MEKYKITILHIINLDCLLCICRVLYLLFLSIPFCIQTLAIFNYNVKLHVDKLISYWSGKFANDVIFWKGI